VRMEDVPPVESFDIDRNGLDTRINHLDLQYRA
jgi:hypothetical protein